MEIKGKHLYGLSALLLGIVALVFSLFYWFINRDFDTTVKATLAAGLIGLALAAWLEIDLITAALKSRQAKYGVEALALTFVFLIVVGLINYIFYQDRFKKRWDLTENKENTLAPETLKTLTELKEPVKAVGFYTSQSAFNQESADKLLKNFSENSGGKFSYEFIDPQLKPTLAQEYNVTRDATLYIERGKQREAVDFADEQSITNAIIRLNNPTIRVVYFLGGHGERDIEDGSELGLMNIRTSLQSVNYKVMPLKAITATIPSDASAIVIAGPTNPYTQSEVDVIAKYLAGGGKAVFVLRPSPLMGIKKGEPDLLADYLAKSWGVTPRSYVVIDPSQYVPQLGPLAPISTKYSQSNPILGELKNIASFYPSTRSFVVADAATAPANVSPSTLVQASATAWGETDFDSINAGSPQPDPNEATGELVIAATSENSSTKGRVVVFGSGDFAVNQFDRQTINGTILINSIKWASGNDSLIALTPKKNTLRTLNIFSIRDQTIVFILSCLLPPFLVILGGVAMWWSRRRSNA